MNIPNKCPKCGAGPKSDPTFLPIMYTCGQLSSDGDRVETHLCLTSQRDQLAAENTALRARVKRLEEVGDYWIPRDADAQEAWANAKGAKL